jgi:plastocyanin
MQNNGTEATGGLARRRDRRLLPLVALTVALALVSACGGAAEESGEATTSSETAPAVVSEPGSEPATSEPAAEADATITGVDYAFEVGDISAGDTVEFVNGSEEEAHEMVVMRVTDDTVTLEDIQQLLAEETEGPPPEFLEEAGFAFAMPGETAEQTVTLDQGRYLLVCFIPQNAPPDLVAQMMESTSSEEPEIPSEVEAELGPPHALAGMVDLVEVE